MTKYRIIQEDDEFFIQKKGYFEWKYVCGNVENLDKMAVIRFESEHAADMFLLKMTDTHKKILSTTTFNNDGKIVERKT